MISESEAIPHIEQFIKVISPFRKQPLQTQCPQLTKSIGFIIKCFAFDIAH